MYSHGCAGSRFAYSKLCLHPLSTISPPSDPGKAAVVPHTCCVMVDIESQWTGSRPPEASLPEHFPFLHLPSHQALGQCAPGGAGAGRVSNGASPKGGVEQRRGQICDRGGYCTVERPVGTLHYGALVPAWPGPAPRYGVPLGPSLGSVLQSGRC